MLVEPIIFGTTEDIASYNSYLASYLASLLEEISYMPTGQNVVLVAIASSYRCHFTPCRSFQDQMHCVTANGCQTIYVHTDQH